MVVSVFRQILWDCMLVVFVSFLFSIMLVQDNPNLVVSSLPEELFSFHAAGNG